MTAHPHVGWRSILVVSLPALAGTVQQSIGRVIVSPVPDLP